MAGISQQKLKEMEAEMSRFEEEISGSFPDVGGPGNEAQAPPPPPPPPQHPSGVDAVTAPKKFTSLPPPPPPPPTIPNASVNIRLATPMRPPGTDGPRLPPPPPPPPPRPVARPSGGMAPRFLPPQLRQQPTMHVHQSHPMRTPMNAVGPPPDSFGGSESAMRQRFLPPPPPPPPQMHGSIGMSPSRPPPAPSPQPPAPVKERFSVHSFMEVPAYQTAPVSRTPHEESRISMNSTISSGPIVLERPKMVYSAPPQLKRPRQETNDAIPVTTMEATTSTQTLSASTKATGSHVGRSSGSDVSAAATGPDDEMEIEPEAVKQDTLVSLTPQLAKRAGNKKLASNRHSQPKQPKKQRFLRVAAGQIWEDSSLAEWDPEDFRLFCGDLGNEVNDDVLTRAFSKYASFQKAKVVRDRRTNKSKGYGFVSFKDPNDFTRAVREMNGKYVGNRPIKLRKSQWQDRQIDVVRKKEKEKRKLGLKV